MEFRIRPADLGDLTAITLIYGRAVTTGTASFETEPPHEEEMAMRYEALVEGCFPYFVAVRGGIILGYAYAGPYRTRPGYRNTVEDSIYVVPEAQGRGVGDALLGTLIADSERRGFRQMVAVIGDSANLGSIRLHERHGFRHIGTFVSVGHKHGRWLDSVLMQRVLGQGDASEPTR